MLFLQYYYNYFLLIILFIIDFVIIFINFEFLFQVCEKLGISNESDYFGLKYTGSKNEELWVNLRNPLASLGVGHGQHRLAMKVKFWVPPHLLLQETTRHQFYVQARQELAEGKLQADDWSTAAKLLALITQAEAGDYDPLRPPQATYSQYGNNFAATDNSPKPTDFMYRVIHEHRDSKVRILVFI